MVRPLLPLLAAASLTAGCGSGGDFPSLAPRAVERELGNFPPVTGPCRDAAPDSDGCYEAGRDPEPAPPADDPALADRINRLREGAEAGQSAFAGRVAAVRAAVERAGPQGSENWIAAQQGISRLEGDRAPVLEAVQALEILAVERAAEPTSAADRARVEEAALAVRAIAAEQQAIIDELSARLSR
jgi:hypothetical protein